MLNFKWDTATAKVHNLWLCIKDTDLIFGFTSLNYMSHKENISFLPS